MGWGGGAPPPPLIAWGVGLLPIFPLDVVVFPGMTVPLYVFEERYKRLVKRCLEAEEQRFVIALARQGGGIRDGGSPVHPVGSFVDVLTLSEQPDGAFQLLAHGQGRCRVEPSEVEQVAEPDGSSRPLHFTEALEHPLQRHDPNQELVVAWDTLDTFRAYAKTFFAFNALEQIDEAIPDDLLYQASFICANIRVPLESRQVLLEAESLSARFQLAQKLMQEMLAAHRPERQGGDAPGG